ncbi:MAG TPA: AraC family transcriptional regulator, partial [Paraburkholderia sp.]
MPKTPDRARPARYLRLPPFTDVLPTPVFFRMEHMPSHATYPQMCHPWGEFVYAFSGTTEVKAGDEHYITPPHLGLWIAPGTEHVGFNEQETVHCSVYISRDLCARMPATSCAVMVSPLVRAILEHLRVTPVEEEGEAQRARLLRVLVDQLSTCATTGSFVPHTED